MSKLYIFIVILLLPFGKTLGDNITEDDIMTVEYKRPSQEPVMRPITGRFKVYKVIKRRKFDTILATLNDEMYMIVSRNRELTNYISHQSICDLEVRSTSFGLLNAKEYSKEGRFSFYLEKRYKVSIVEVFFLEKIISD